MAELFFEDVQEGDALPEWQLEKVSRTHFVKYAGASGDFNPMHHDDTVAQAVGYPSVFGHGMFTAGVLSGYVTRAIGGVVNLRAYATRFKTQLWPGDTITCTATVAKKYKEGDENRVDLALEATNQDGKTLIQGTATAALPNKG